MATRRLPVPRQRLGHPRSRPGDAVRPRQNERRRRAGRRGRPHHRAVGWRRGARSRHVDGVLQRPGARPVGGDVDVVGARADVQTPPTNGVEGRAAAGVCWVCAVVVVWCGRRDAVSSLCVSPAGDGHEVVQPTVRRVQSRGLDVQIFGAAKRRLGRRGVAARRRVCGATWCGVGRHPRSRGGGVEQKPHAAKRHAVGHRLRPHHVFVGGWVQPHRRLVAHVPQVHPCGVHRVGGHTDRQRRAA